MPILTLSGRGINMDEQDIQDYLGLGIEMAEPFLTPNNPVYPVHPC